MKYVFKRMITVVRREEIEIDVVHVDRETAEKEKGFYQSFGAITSEVTEVPDDFIPYRAEGLSCC